MTGRGMGAATKGGGCVSSGARNRVTSKPSTKIKVMMKDGGDPGKVVRRGKTTKRGETTAAELEFLRQALKNTPKKISKAKKALKAKEAPAEKKRGGMMYK